MCNLSEDGGLYYAARGVFTRVLHGGSIRAGMEFEQIDGVNRDESL